MNDRLIFKGLIIRKEIIESQEFYTVKNLQNANEYKIVKFHLEGIDGLSVMNTYDFLIYVKEERDEISIINPKYPIDSEIHFEINKIITKNQKLYFELKSNYPKPLTVEAKFFQIDQIEKVRCKIIDYRYGRPYFQNVDLTNCPWVIGETYFFKILNFLETDNKNLDRIEIDLGFGHSSILASGVWHKPNLWDFEDIECEVVSIFKDGLPKLKIVDNRHPIYKIGNSYYFNVLKFEKRIIKTGEEIKLIILTDETNILYEVFAFPNQENKILVGTKIECEVVKIDFKLRLKQINKEDPFYYKFEEIEPDLAIQNKFFTPSLHNESAYNFKLLEQYSKGSGFWVMTYMNHILPNLLIDYRKRKDIKDLIALLNLGLKINQWLSKRGFLKAIIDEKDRKNAKIKVQQSIDIFEIERFVVKSLTNHNQNVILDKFIKEKKTSIIFFFVLHSELSHIDFQNIYLCLVQIKKSEIDDHINKYYLTRLIKLVRLKVGNINNYLDKNFFILSNEGSKQIKDVLLQSINWLFLCSELCLLSGFSLERNFYLSEVFRLFSLTSNDFKTQKKLLFAAFQTVSNNESESLNPFEFKNNELILKLELFNTIELTNPLALSLNYYSFLLEKKHFKGYTYSIDEYKGYLPYENIIDSKLRNYKPDILKWETNVTITHQCNFFKIFIANQIPADNSNYLSTNLMINNLEIGSIIEATVKNVTDFGVFVTTAYGDGLIHISEISEDLMNLESMSYIFKKNLIIPVYVLNHSISKIEFSFKRLKNSSYKNVYNEIIENSSLQFLDPFKDEYDEKNIKLEEEKGYIFDRAAKLTTDIMTKIKYLEFSKYFFSNTKNARSYLTTVYIKYFKLLLTLDELLLDYSYEKYNTFKLSIKEIKKNVDFKTLDNFPESKNLLFFIDILFLFNSKDEIETEELFYLTKSSKDSADSFLIPVAKNALANNLLISEIDNNNIDELNQFTFKNLKRIREFISKGVLTVSESTEDLLEKELESKRKFWLGRIANDEGENLEFKATFKTPTTDKNKNSIIENIKKQINKSNDAEIIKNLQIKIKEIENENRVDAFINQKLIHSSLKTICAFANTNGGHLLLGVSDDKKIYGLEQDYASFKSNDRDSFGKFFDSKINEYFGNSFSSSLLRKEFLKFPEGDILIIEVLASNDEVFLLKNEKGEPEQSIYVRNLSSSENIKGIELVKFIRRKMTQQFENLNSNFESKSN